MIILGIDPGLASTGFGAVRCDPGNPGLFTCGYIKTSPRQDMPGRLFQIYSDLQQILLSVKPDLMAVENVFSLARYPRAGMILGGVLGVIYLGAVQNGVRITDISPREVKNALVGHGSATKTQVKETTRRILGVDDIRTFHAADALAVALTAFYRGARTTRGKR